MKKINILGQEYGYQTYTGCDEGGSWSGTKFFLGEEVVRYRKYWLFGPVITKSVPKMVLEVYFNIESPNYTKEELIKRLEEPFRILNRTAEIARGEII